MSPRLTTNQLCNGLSCRASRFASNHHQTSCQKFPTSSGLCPYNSVRVDQAPDFRSNLLPNHQLKLASQQLTRKYSVAQVYPDTSPAIGLERNSASIDHIESEKQSNSSQHSDLANDKVENWTSRAYFDIPFRPDFTLFEPIETHDDPSHRELYKELPHQFKSRMDMSMSDRLAHLIRYDPSAAEQLKSELIENRIELVANPQITSHCFNLLFKHQNIESYLGWLPLVTSRHLQQNSSPGHHPPISIVETHLNQILKLAPNELSFMSRFLEILVTKQCISRHLTFTLIRHLARTQEPDTVSIFTEKIFSMANKEPFPPEVIKPSQDFLVLQLANQGHLSHALQLFHKNLEQRSPSSESNMPKVYPLIYQVLADQLVSRIEKDNSQGCQDWLTELKKVTSYWRIDHKNGFDQWLNPNTSKYLESHNLTTLTRRVSKKYVKVFSDAITVNPEVCCQFSFDKLHHLTAYFRSLFDENHHPKFVKASQLANQIHQILPLRNSFPLLQDKLKLSGDHHSRKTEEQIFKLFVSEPPSWLSNTSTRQGDGKVRNDHHIKFEARSDIVLLWAHSWMIFYHRSGRPHRAIEIFLDYFIPIGCDLKLLDRIRHGPNQNDALSKHHFKGVSLSTIEPKFQKLIHPTTGVLTVLYDSILSLCPPKFIPVLFDSFLAQHFHPDTERSRSFNSHISLIKRRLEPNLGSFRPFVRAFLKVKDVNGALNVLESMHLNLNYSLNRVAFENNDEGGWIDLLEWCATHSSGPKPKGFDPNYHWGAQRKRKIKGWDGKMKEDLIYLILKKFFRLKFNSANTPSSSSLPSSMNFSFLERSGLDKSLVDIQDDKSKNNPSKFDSIQTLKIFRIKSSFIDEKLKFLDIQKNDLIGNLSTNHSLSSLISSNFPSLKLILKIKFGFYLAKNSKGLKFINKLLIFYK